MKRHSIINKQQFGFVEKAATEDAVLHLTDHVIQNLDQRKKILTLFLDLQKAFDTVPHNLLQQKFDKIGIRGNVNKLIGSYLSNRTQIVKIDNAYSDSLPVTYGVPQGSVLGPLLFIMFINDIFIQEPTATSIAYADDTSVTFVEDTLDGLYHNANNGLHKIFMWLSSCGLALNIKKTKYIQFAFTKAGIQDTNHTLKLHSDCVD